MQYFAVRDGAISRPLGQEDRYENISRFELRDEVPADVRVHFDTARNLYGGHDQQHIERPMLSRLLQLAVEHGLIHNENFANRSQWAQTMAEHRVRIQQLEYMTANGLIEIAIEDEAPIPPPEEFDHDSIATFIETLPSIRNTYAHGSSMLHASVLRTFDVVADLIN